MAHTDQPESIIPQKPPPPPRREGADPIERPAVDPQAPTEPGDRRPVPADRPSQPPQAPQVAGARGPTSSRRGSRKPSGHIAVPQLADDLDVLTIGRSSMALIDYPRGHHVSRDTSLSPSRSAEAHR